jgi:hypothetical protein
MEYVCVCLNGNSITNDLHDVKYHVALTRHRCNY